MDKKQSNKQEVQRLKKMNEFMPEENFRIILDEYNKKFGWLMRWLHT